jgi:uncharacterized membrane protein YgdD (TMEM256/DUF423 family)
MERIIAAAAGLAGLSGVALAAMAAHGPGGPSLDVAARFLLVHAAALLGVAALSGTVLSSRLAGLAALLLAIGLVLFCGDLVRRATAGTGLFPMAAPAGGFALMAGWLVVVGAAVAGPRP